MMESSKHSSTITAQAQEQDLSVFEESHRSQAKKKKSFLRFLIKLFFIFAFLMVFLSLLAVNYFRLSPGKTNFLILGVAGENHAGSDLTDTMIFLSIDHSSGRSLMLSLPRDIWIASLRTKLNSVYHYRGIEGTKIVVKEIIGQPADHYLIIDFNLFKQVVDLLGGVEVEVVGPLDDYHYPIAGRENDLCDGDPEFSCRYEHFHLDAGSQVLDGDKALKFARSRYADGEEGTDFARNQRQQQLVAAVKQKLSSPKVLLSPRALYRLFLLMVENIKTDMSQDDLQLLGGLLLKFRSEEIKAVVLNNDLLINPSPSQQKYDGQWVLVPAGENWEEVKAYVNNLLEF